jgi:AcrR family transcriptional regulator
MTSVQIPSAAYEAALNGADSDQATPARAFTLARQFWLEGRRVDMSEIAASLGVSRPTLYKWCGDRNQLLTDIIWSLAEADIEQIWAASADLKGTERLLSALRVFLEHLSSVEPLKAFVQNETHAALRLLTTRGGYQDRLVEAVAERLQEEVEAGHLQLRSDPSLIAYAVVRIIEGFVYDYSIVSVEPQVDSAIEVVELLIN